MLSNLNQVGKHYYAHGIEDTNMQQKTEGDYVSTDSEPEQLHLD
jgi:hypothetical protein